MSKDIWSRLLTDRRSVWLLAGLGLLGILLIGISEWTDPPSLQRETSPAPVQADETELLESRLRSLISQIEGAGETAVMITYEGTSETVYALDRRESASGSEQSHIILNGGSGEEALVDMVWYPTVQGVVIVCRGAENAAVRAEVTEAACVLLGVSSNRVSVSKMAD